MVEVVQLTSEQWQTLRDLRMKATMDTPFAFGLTLQEVLSRTEEEWREYLTNSVYYGAREGNNFVGMLRVAPEKGDMRSHVAQIYGVYVLPEARNKGAGRMLMETALNNLKKDDHMLKVRLTVAETQKEAQHLYERLGFKQVGIFEKDASLNGQYVDVLVMEKFLR